MLEYRKLKTVFEILILKVKISKQGSKTQFSFLKTSHIRSWIFVFPPRLVLVALVSFFLRFHVETGAKKKTELAPN